MACCPRCGEDNPEGARFCLSCGASLAPARVRAERKSVSVLFADLVGFTSAAERLDPEDVRALQNRYWGHMRAEIELHGGTVEKFIGDAVVGLFGAPFAHEDDPERAVRAALAIRDWAQEREELAIRVGVTTGEALVLIGAQPLAGEGMASGDVVNTASRLQNVAATNTILVDDKTFRATCNSIDYRKAEHVQAKGKVDPVAAWEAVETRSPMGVRRYASARFVGRGDELGTLINALVRVKREREPQLVTLVGVPGIGKSRLVHELYRSLDESDELICWLRGRSRAYGGGEALGALVEIVKTWLRIVDSDSAERLESNLVTGVGDLLSDDDDRKVIEQELRPLLGLAPRASEGGDRRAEISTDALDRREASFAAWRRFFEALAEQGPLALVFEDLHWADEQLLDFVDSLVDYIRGVPMLVVATARPELLSTRSDWGGGKPNASTLSLAPLTDEETRTLLEALLGPESVGSSQDRSTLVEHAAGNPLYAEEYAHLVAERGGDADELEMPSSIHGIIAARIDALARPDKDVLLDAAVIGRFFWRGAISRLGGLARSELERRLHELERREFVRRERRPAVAEETQFVFRHALIRDVAYGQMPRSERGEKHQRAAEWFLSLGQPQEHAETVAHHYASALEYRRAGHEVPSDLEDSARSAFRAAAEQALAKNAAATAADFYQSALDLSASISDEAARGQFRRELTLRLAEARFKSYDSDGAIAAAEEVASEAAEISEIATLAQAYGFLYVANLVRGSRERAATYRDLSLPMFEELGDLSGQAMVLNTIGIEAYYAGDWARALDAYERSRALYVQLGDVTNAAMAINNIGEIRSDQGRIEEADKLFAEVEQTCISTGKAPGLTALARANRGRVAARAARFDEADQLLGEALHTFGEMGARSFTRETEARLAEAAALRADRPRQAIALAQSLLDQIEDQETPLYAFSLRIKALGLLQLGETAAAITSLQESVRVARAANTSYELALSLDLLASIQDDPRAAAESASLLAELGVERAPQLPVSPTRVS